MYKVWVSRHWYSLNEVPMASRTVPTNSPAVFARPLARPARAMRRLLAVVACSGIAAAMAPSMTPSVTSSVTSSVAVLLRQQGDKASPTKEQLDKEREALRMKDVEAWKKMQVKSLDDVMDVKKQTQPLELPTTISDADKTKMTELLQKAKESGGGAATGRALKQLEKMGHPALFFLVNALREVDYKSVDESMFAMQINQTLTNMTMGVNTGFVPPDLGEPMDPRKAQWNAQTVKEWQKGVLNFWPTKEKFDEYIKNRRAKKDAELQDGEPGKDKAGEKKGDEKKG